MCLIVLDHALLIRKPHTTRYREKKTITLGHPSCIDAGTRRVCGSTPNSSNRRILVQKPTDMNPLANKKINNLTIIIGYIVT